VVAFIGLGALGRPMAANLLRAGHPLHVHNRTPDAARPLLEAGAQWAASPAKAAAAAPCLCLCLSDDAAVEAVLGAAIAGLKPGSLVIDFSTISPATSQSMATALQRIDVAYLGSPEKVSRSHSRQGVLLK
jgi:3-hydroxyisobutyrate dehydrogenase-like beta-hydroxyacid dehydrogenase